MPRFFCEPLTGEQWEIVGEDARHIAGSLRMAVGDTLTLCDTKGTDYHGMIETIEKDRVVGKILKQSPCQSEPNLFVTLYMAMPKADKAEWVIQKSVELGVGRIVFVLTHRCVSRPDDKAFAKKQERFAKIAREAAKQSGRGCIPGVDGLYSFGEMLQETAGKHTLLFYEQATIPLAEALPPTPEPLHVIVGAEGGFEPWEVEMAQAQGAKIASLGKRILRCETAPMAALSAILYAYGNF